MYYKSLISSSKSSELEKSKRNQPIYNVKFDFEVTCITFEIQLNQFFMEENKNKNPGNGIALGACFGVVFGAAYGIFSGNIATGSGLGLAIGVFIGAIIDFKNRK